MLSGVSQSHSMTELLQALQFVLFDVLIGLAFDVPGCRFHSVVI